MSVNITTVLTGLHGTNSEFEKAMNVKLICDENGISYPREVIEAFGTFADRVEGEIREELTEVTLLSIGDYGNKHESHIPIIEIEHEYGKVLEFNLSDIPEGFERIRLKLLYS